MKRKWIAHITYTLSPLMHDGVAIVSIAIIAWAALMLLIPWNSDNAPPEIVAPISQIAIMIFGTLLTVWFFLTGVFARIVFCVSLTIKKIIVGLRERLQNPIGRLVNVHWIVGELGKIDEVGQIVDVTRSNNGFLHFHVLVNGTIVTTTRGGFIFIDDTEK